MKDYIESEVTYSGRELGSVLEHMFCCLGNGVGLDNKGYLSGNYRSEEVYSFPEQPVPLKHIYPWSKTERFQPFRDLAGCRDVGFKETVNYFLSCLEITPDTVEGILPWKANTGVVRKVLLETPTIQDEFTDIDSGMETFLGKISNTKPTAQNPIGSESDGGNSVTKRWFFDVQWSDCPKFVEEEVRYSWREKELGNDNYFWTATMDEVLFENYPNIYFWLKHKGVPEGESVIVHWWW